MAETTNILNLNALDPQSLLRAAQNFLTTTDDERVAAARRQVESEIFGSQQAMDWARSAGLDVASTLHGPEGLRNPAGRDSVIWGMLQNFYDCNDDANAIKARFARDGFDNGTTTHTYLINMGPGSLGRGASNHEAVMVVDESANPPIITLNFRGSNMTATGTPGAWREGMEGNNIFQKIFDMVRFYVTGAVGSTPIPEWLTHFKAATSMLFGNKVEAYDGQSEAFWQSAGPDITRIINEVQSRHPGAAPQIVLAGHSYGVDGATRMVPKLAEAFPALRGNISLVGFGGMPSFSRDEQASIYALLGNSPERARQYMNRNDIIDPVGMVQQYVPLFDLSRVVPSDGVVGVRRTMQAGDGHFYAAPAQMLAMINTIEQDFKADPRAAAAEARALVDAYKRDPNSVLRTLSEYTANASRGSALSAILPNLAQIRAQAVAA